MADVFDQQDADGDARKASKPTTTTSWGLYATIAIALSLAALAAGFILAPPRFYVIFEDFGVELPRASVLILRTSRQIANVLIAAVFFIVAIEFVESWRDWRKTVRWAALGLICAGCVIAVLAIGLPLLKLINALS